MKRFQGKMRTRRRAVMMVRVRVGVKFGGGLAEGVR